MLALITGASSGIGKAIAYQLAKENIDLILVARREGNLLQISNEIKQKYQISVIYETMDVSILNNLEKLVEKYPNIDILVNNAGFGDSGLFINTSLEKEMNMLDLNIKSLHYLTKKYVKLFSNENKGYILNVSSLAAFQSGPKMATYYASKAYVLSLSEAINYELKKEKINVSITTLCPGPVKTEFNKVANVKFSIKEMSPEKVAKKAVTAMFKRKSIVIPSFKEKVGVFLERFIPRRLQLKIICNIQERKQGK